MSIDHESDLSAFSMMQLFRMEAGGQARTLTVGLLAMESCADAGDAAIAESLMRAAHAIKGAAAIVGLDVVVQIAHAMEDAFVTVQHGQLQLTPARIDVLLAGVDLIVQCSMTGEASIAGWLGQNAARIEAAMAQLVQMAQMAQLSQAPPQQQQQPQQQPGAESSDSSAPPPPLPRAAARDYDRRLALSGETRINARQLVPVIASLQRFKRNQASLFQAIETLHEALVRGAHPALAEQCALALQKTHPLKQMLHEHMAELDSYERRVLSVSNKLVDEVLALRMRPFGDGVHAFGRMVRDLARSLGKQAQLTIIGADTPVDRDILAAIEGPLNHMLRNAVDHGIETPGARIAAGKPAAGAIVVEARHRNGMLSIVVSDDGHGVDFDKIRRSVVARELASMPMAQAMSKAELMEFLFLPAFTLKETATAISGRGVGLDIVLRAIRAQHGSVRMESVQGQGLRTSITLPLTQSIVRALVVDIEGEAYAIPIVKIERVLKLARADLHSLGGKQFFDYDGEHLGLILAAQVLELGRMTPAAGELAVVVIGAGLRRYALAVDAIRGEQSLVVQPIDQVFGKLRDIAAAALLDDGAPVLILDVADLLLSIDKLLLSIDKLLREGGLQPLARAGEQGGEQKQRQSRRILVVDDSPTVREMEKKLLQGRGYQVDTAIDGVDGWNMVRSSACDLVITDVDMPRMDGIELVAMIRTDIHAHKLPVMIVSYKDRPHDRARGMTAGADYYLTKGSFHDESLLDAVFDVIGGSGA